MPNIEALKELEALHRNFDQTTIKEFDQDGWPIYGTLGFGECGCVGHTWHVVKGYGDIGISIIINEFNLGMVEEGFIFGFTEEIRDASDMLNYTIAHDYKFTATDAADRIAFIISLYEKES